MSEIIRLFFFLNEREIDWAIMDSFESRSSVLLTFEEDTYVFQEVLLVLNSDAEKRTYFARSSTELNIV